MNQSTRSSIDSLDNFDEDDLGPMASPLRPLRTFDEEDSNTSNASNANGAAQALEIENQKLKAAVSIMAREMEEVWFKIEKIENVVKCVTILDCNYRYSDFFDLIPLLMSFVES